MRLSGILSNPISNEFIQVQGFLDNKNLKSGKMRKIDVGKVSINFNCKTCNCIRTFYSDQYLYCIGVNNRIISIDCVIECPCGSSVQLWFLLESENDISSLAPTVRVLKRSEKFSDFAMGIKDQYGDFTEFLEKAERAAREGFGAGAIVYLRKVFENITVQMANVVEIDYPKYEGGNPKNFSALLEEVDDECSIIPKEFANNRKKFFKELSGVVHGNYSEEEALLKFDAFNRLVKGVLDNVRTNQELMVAIGTLGWNDGGE